MEMRVKLSKQEVSKVKVPRFGQGDSPRSPKFEFPSFWSPHSFQELILEQVHPYEELIKEAHSTLHFPNPFLTK